eukprot:Sdes_comp19844_c0_seq5m12066
MVKYIISRKAYYKPILHSYRHFDHAVNGILVGKLVDGNVLLQDAIPLFHSHLELEPMLVVAFKNVEAYCKAKGMLIVGYYHAYETEMSEGNLIDPIVSKIAHKIREQFENACILIIKAENFSQIEDDKMAFHFFTPRGSDGSWVLNHNESE